MYCDNVTARSRFERMTASLCPYLRMETNFGGGEGGFPYNRTNFFFCKNKSGA